MWVVMVGFIDVSHPSISYIGIISYGTYKSLNLKDYISIYKRGPGFCYFYSLYDLLLLQIFQSSQVTIHLL